MHKNSYYFSFFVIIIFIIIIIIIIIITEPSFSFLAWVVTILVRLH